MTQRPPHILTDAVGTILFTGSHRQCEDFALKMGYLTETQHQGYTTIDWNGYRIEPVKGENMDIENINATPLETGLRRIDEMLKQSVSGAQEMRDLLWAIKDEVEVAAEGFRKNITAAQEAELAELRKAVRG